MTAKANNPMSTTKAKLVYRGNLFGVIDPATQAQRPNAAWALVSDGIPTETSPFVDAIGKAIRSVTAPVTHEFLVWVC